MWCTVTLLKWWWIILWPDCGSVCPCGMLHRNIHLSQFKYFLPPEYLLLRASHNSRDCNTELILYSTIKVTAPWLAVTYLPWGTRKGPHYTLRHNKQLRLYAFSSLLLRAFHCNLHDHTCPSSQVQHNTLYKRILFCPGHSYLGNLAYAMLLTATYETSLWSSLPSILFYVPCT